MRLYGSIRIPGFGRLSPRLGFVTGNLTTLVRGGSAPGSAGGEALAVLFVGSFALAGVALAVFVLTR